MAKDFKADLFNPEKLLSAARKAGFQYAVLTTKHHDGFALWPSKVGDFNIGQYQPGRDLVREYVDGCRKAGLKVGFYYSPPDWYFNRDFMSFGKGQGKAPLDIHHKPCKLPERSPDEVTAWADKNRAYVKAQTEELLTHYGKIDILWFDGSADKAISVERIRELQPGILLNTRGLGVGDFKTPECKFPEKAQVEGWWWEYCHVGYDGGWGYRNHDGYKPAGWILAEFVKARSWGGNFLPNYGPDARGEMPPVFYKRMEQIAQWMEKHAESVLGVEPGPWPEQSDVPVTVRGNTWYIHFDYLNDGLATLQEVGKPVAARLLRTGEPVPFEYKAGTLTITLPEDMRTTLVDVVAVTF
jgi:alpha-L-fucosidase